MYIKGVFLRKFPNGFSGDVIVRVHDRFPAYFSNAFMLERCNVKLYSSGLGKIFARRNRNSIKTTLPKINQRINSLLEAIVRTYKVNYFKNDTVINLVNCTIDGQPGVIGVEIFQVQFIWNSFPLNLYKIQKLAHSVANIN